MAESRLALDDPVALAQASAILRGALARKREAERPARDTEPDARRAS